MNLIEHAIHSIDQAEQLKSKLTSEAFAVPGMTSPKIRHLLNNLGSMSSLNYLEVGVHKGGTFVSAVYKNQMQSVTAVDNWCEFAQDGASRDEFYRHCTNLLSHAAPKIIEADCFSLTKADLPSPISMYLYDGAHDYDAQYKAITYFYEMMADEFILMVDDYRWGDANRATQDAIRDLKLEVLFDRSLPSLVDGDTENYWNGFYVGVLKKGNHG